MAHASHHGPVAVGNELAIGSWLLAISYLPIIVILHNHDAVTATEFFLHVQYHIADTLIKDVGAFVRACHHDGIILPYLTIA